MKVITYSGYSRMKNFGDWWLYEIIKNSLSPIKLLALDRVVSRYGLRRSVYKLWRANILPSPTAALLGGGTILLPHKDFMQHLESVKCKKYSIGTGAKSVEECERWNLVSPDQRLRILELLNSMAEVTVRGPISEETTRALGFKGNVSLVGDPMLSWFKPHQRIQPTNHKVVLLNVADLDSSQKHYWQHPQNIWAVYEQLIDSYQYSGYVVKIFYCAPEDAEISIALAKKYALEAPSSTLIPEQLTAILQQGCGLIATRLHAMIYAIIRGFPSAVLAYQDKHLDFLRSVDLAEGTVRLKDLNLNNVVEDFEAVWTQQLERWEQTSNTITQLNIARDALYKQISKN